MQEFQSGRGSSFQGEEANANPSDHCQRGENIAPAPTSILLFRVNGRVSWVGEGGPGLLTFRRRQGYGGTRRRDKKARSELSPLKSELACQP